MTYDDVVTFYGDATKASRKLGVTRAAVSYWREHGIPPGRQALIHMLTRGRLKAAPVQPGGSNGKRARATA